ncbi:MAG: hypothetical protein JXN60_09070 [Lentisphaerae bacterium]|nr:hypothetical protein [Lentisphaerota bacterium]
MTRKFSIRVASLIVCATIFGNFAHAKTENGNDFCLYLLEALDSKRNNEATHLIKEAEDVNYFFRYLEIIDIGSGKSGDFPYVDMVTREPSSYFTLKFRVNKKVSLTKLAEEPVSDKGSAIAISGRIAKVDIKSRTIFIDPVIVRYKDNLAPKAGKELLGEVDSSAVYYSYTAVKGKKVSISYADRDLIDDNRTRIPEYNDSDAKKEAWADFLLKEKSKRDKIRAQKAKEAKIKAGIIKNDTELPFTE